MLLQPSNLPASSDFYGTFFIFVIIGVAIIVLIISLIMLASNRKKKEDKDAMKLFEEMQNFNFEDKK